MVDEEIARVIAEAVERDPAFSPPPPHTGPPNEVIGAMLLIACLFMLAGILLDRAASDRAHEEKP
jgi:hypothetical protein